jgi:hypothetical protein
MTSREKITENNHFVMVRLGNSFRTRGSPFHFSIKPRVSHSAIRPSETLLLPKALVVSNLSAFDPCPQNKKFKRRKTCTNTNAKVRKEEEDLRK